MIKKLRNKVDKIDSQILRLLQQRNKIAKQIGKYKKTNGSKVFDSKREKEVLRKVKEKSIKFKLNTNFTREIFIKIMKEGKRLQR